MKRVCFTALVFLASFQLQAQSTVKGFVYQDLNHNGKRDHKDLGVADVAVTNGVQVVLTDKSGLYTLPIGKDNIVSVIKPSGYKTGVNADQLPQFFYNHKPGGSPVLKYKGVLPTGVLPASVDFPLTMVKENENFKMLVFGDPQPITLKDVDYFYKGVISEVKGIKGVEFGLSMGDLVQNKLELFTPYIKAVKDVGIPWYNLLGNHDLDFDGKADSLADETYEAHFGPANYAFNYAKVHFIVLDDILYPDPRDGKGYWGGFRKEQLDFVENELKYVPEDYLIVLAFHIPISEPKEGGDPFRDEDRQRLFDILARFPHTLSLSAHTHGQKQDFFTKEQGWKQEKPHHHYNVGTTSGNWYSGELNAKGVPVATMSDGTPKGYAFINFKQNAYTIDYKVVDMPADYQIAITAPKILEKNKGTAAVIYANFFMGSPGDTVMCRIDSGKWTAMNYVLQNDPTFLDLIHKWDHSEVLLSGRRPGLPALCRHLWSTPVQPNLPVGDHVIEVKAIDIFGRTFTQKSSYKIALLESNTK
ncbi:metallophosphoesterase [Pedobacter hiemivivus]|uniref:Metallophosphoesterase n=1 Tax=Pedobacter hiemivivus TaxID=2530454 RepID=A0A4U1GPV4_9SPHI|nr:calcineurin-like phosphoesterase C-terminal domain-containing protein [Pedobacter hiemivivus]TKC65183.1 metallophosphoesterase [Pedobacter hiemivivus]